MKPKTRRLIWLGFTLGCFSVGTYSALQALKDNLVFYYTPSELRSQVPQKTTKIRVGGYVASKSLKHPEPLKVTFTLTDFHHSLEVTYSGPLPDLFREGQGCVAEGFLETPTQFKATTVLAKHDENYRPPLSVETKNPS